MGMRWALAALCLPALALAISPEDLVPMRWPWPDARPLALLANSPINCILLPPSATQIAAAAARQGIVPLAILHPGDTLDPVFEGAILEGGTAPPGKLRIPLRSRADLFASPSGPIAATSEALWPGIRILAGGAAQAGPSAAPWIDTNGGFLRSLRARTPATLWIANTPPTGQLLKPERYLQSLCDAAMSGARWVISLDDDFARRLAESDPAALRAWQRILTHLRYFEDHPAWRALPSYSQLAIVQDPADGPALASGVLDMVSTRHIPARALALDRLAPASFEGTRFAVDINPARVTPPQFQLLQSFTRSGGTLLTGPTGWRQTTLEKQEMDRLNDVWHEVQSMIGRRNMGARLFNVSSMLSTLLGPAAGSRLVLHLLNYSGYPVESVTIHLPAKYRRATLLSPGAAPKPLELYETEEGTGVDLDRVSVFATVYLEQ